MSYVRYNVSCLRDYKKIGLCSTNFHNTLSQISTSSSFRLKISIFINTSTIVSKLHSFTMHDMKSTLMLLKIFTMTPENFRFNKRYQIFTFFESSSEKYFRSFLFYGYKKEVRTSENKETLQALPHIDFSLINIFTDRYMFFYLN